MSKYTESELVQLRSTAVIPTAFDFLEFTRAIEEQREAQSKAEEENAANPSARRRSSHNSTRPKFTFNRKPRRVHEPTQPDADGWVTLNKKKASFGAEEGSEQKETFRETIKDQQVNKIRPNSKKIASASPADPRDIIAEKPKSRFNAFAALNSEDEDDDEDDDE